MAPVHWSLEVRGRLRPRAVLVDGDGRDVARVRRDGRVRVLRAGEATDAEGRLWRVVGPGNDLRVSCDGEPRATARAEGEGLTVGGRTLAWQASLEGGRTATATDDEGELLRVAPGPGGDGPWVTIERADGLPSPLAATLATLFVLLRVDALGRRG